MERVRINEAKPEAKPKEKSGGGLYFPAEKSIAFIPTGCTLLDCVLGGGWALGRVANIIGDKSCGKTLLAIEACANFAQKYPKGKIWYREAEAAFDEGYAAELGLPVKRMDFGPEGLGTCWDTIEDIFEDLDHCVEAATKAGVEGLYIIDSLDAVSSKSELKRDPEKGSFGLEKQKLLGRLFRQLVRRIQTAKVAVIIISQVRDNIGVMFGEKHKRSGGKALDFYATHALWLSHLENIKSTRGGINRVVGVRIRARCKKNKIAAPLRECAADLLFGFGLDDLGASLEWLLEVKELSRLDLKESGVPEFLKKADKAEGAELKAIQEAVSSAVVAAWADVEKRFAPTRKKYG